MKILKKIITEVEVEVDFPCYRKSNLFYWKLNDEKNGIKISRDGIMDIGYTAYCSAFEDWTIESNEKEFFEEVHQYHLLLNKILKTGLNYDKEENS